MTPEGERQLSEQRARCAAINAQHTHLTWFWLGLTDQEIQDLVRGLVPEEIRARCQFALDSAEYDAGLVATTPIRRTTLDPPPTLHEEIIEWP